MKNKLDGTITGSDMDYNQYYRDWAANSNFTFDLDAPFSSVDARKFYLDYSIYFNKFGISGTNERRELWAILQKARKKLQSHEYEDSSNE